MPYKDLVQDLVRSYLILTRILVRFFQNLLRSYKDFVQDLVGSDFNQSMSKIFYHVIKMLQRSCKKT